MKDRLNLTIDETLLDKVKRYAGNRKISVSQLVEDYFERLTRPTNEKNIVELMESLPQPKKVPTGDLKKQYFQDKKSKYGF